MNRDTLLHIIRFISLILIQVLILNHVDFLGYLNPYIYIIFILLAPININKSLFLLLSFILGLTIDIFGDSGGVHAAACLVIAFFRPIALRTVFGLSYEFQTVKLSNTRFGEKLAYVILLVLTHHIVLFSLEIFNFSHILLIAKKTLFTSLFTIVITMLILVLFRRNDS
ncbi:rod shape-determining protein MreD [Aquimarina sp. AD10]|uniref:Rod shape-determining protein MreD n=1 Tax=Aquimarina aggregata TaxID=1642818 RepID=A0A162YVP3_9FLAO|nr:MULTISPECIES: rod shape-determining protein MreD [Aquimarina]AXT61291.1 rod shape-determining protein MreD [Aquimarina sp. AD10]KZS39387.1 rod shape-determining protein MreD [Aquimarina aggregata]RKN01514.1 rod shape-determining protein MreD [Aquimarina sp. AD10]